MAEVLSVGETREFEIIYENDAEGSLTLSLRRMQVRRPWDTGCGWDRVTG